MVFASNRHKSGNLEASLPELLKLEWITAEEFKIPINTFFSIINPLSLFLENLRYQLSIL